jgi:hypothetical protein
VFVRTLEQVNFLWPVAWCAASILKSINHDFHSLSAAPKDIKFLVKHIAQRSSTPSTFQRRRVTFIGQSISHKLSSAEKDIPVKLITWDRTSIIRLFMNIENYGNFYRSDNNFLLSILFAFFFVWSGDKNKSMDFSHVFVGVCAFFFGVGKVWTRRPERRI